MSFEPWKQSGESIWKATVATRGKHQWSIIRSIYGALTYCCSGKPILLAPVCILPTAYACPYYVIADCGNMQHDWPHRLLPRKARVDYTTSRLLYHFRELASGKKHEHLLPPGRAKCEVACPLSTSREIDLSQQVGGIASVRPSCERTVLSYRHWIRHKSAVVVAARFTVPRCTGTSVIGQQSAAIAAAANETSQLKFTASRFATGNGDDDLCHRRKLAAAAATRLRLQLTCMHHHSTWIYIYDTEPACWSWVSSGGLKNSSAARQHVSKLRTFAEWFYQFW